MKKTYFVALKIGGFEIITGKNKADAHKSAMATYKKNMNYVRLATDLEIELYKKISDSRVMPAEV